MHQPVENDEVGRLVSGEFIAFVQRISGGRWRSILGGPRDPEERYSRAGDMRRTLRGQIDDVFLGMCDGISTLNNHNEVLAYAGLEAQLLTDGLERGEAELLLQLRKKCGNILQATAEAFFRQHLTPEHFLPASGETAS